MTKKVHIKSKSRFFIFVMVCLFAIAGIFNCATNVYAQAASPEQNEYISVNVNEGDTLWDIAEAYMPADMDIREAVYILKKTNDINSDIRDGQTILVPNYNN